MVPTAFLNVAEKRETSRPCLCRELHPTVSLDRLWYTRYYVDLHNC